MTCDKSDKSIDVTGTCCPLPLIALTDAVRSMTAGQRLQIVGDDPVFERSIREFCQAHGHTILDSQLDGRRITFILQI